MGKECVRWMFGRGLRIKKSGQNLMDWSVILHCGGQSMWSLELNIDYVPSSHFPLLGTIKIVFLHDSFGVEELY